MTDGRLHFRQGSYLKRLLTGLVIISMAIAISSGFAWATNSAYMSYVNYINRPPFSSYTSKLGSITFTYPSSMVLEHKTYGDDHIESVTLRRSYNASDATDSNLRKYDGLVFINVNNMGCRYQDCTKYDSKEAMKEEMDHRVESFREVYFYEDPEKPDDLKRKEGYGYKVTRIHDNRMIGGHKTEYYSIEEEGTGYNLGDYKKRIFILIPVGDFLYEVDGHAETNQYDEISHDTDFLDALVDSIKIGSEQ